MAYMYILYMYVIRSAHWFQQERGFEGSVQPGDLVQPSRCTHRSVPATVPCQVWNYLVLYHSVIPSAKNCKAFRKALVCEESVEADSVECGQFSVAVRQVEKCGK